MMPITNIVSDTVSSSLTGLVGEIRQGLDDFFTSDEERLDAEFRLKKLLQESNNLQAIANIESAKSDSFFVAAARPSALWMCVAGFGWEFVFRPFIAAGLTIASLWGADPELMILTANDLPNLDSDALMTLMFALLGLAGWRTAEKVKGVARESMPTRHSKNK